MRLYIVHDSQLGKEEVPSCVANTHHYDNTTNTNYGVNRDASGHLSGYAWNTNVGWINFSPTDGGVTIDPATGSFDGYAWGENVGWIHFVEGAGDIYLPSILKSFP